MNNTLEYLKKIIDVNVEIEKLNPGNNLSLHLKRSFEYFLINFLDSKFVLLKPTENQSVDKLKKQMDIIAEEMKMPSALLFEDVTPYKVKKMINERVAFISEENQMYLPFMAIHLKKQNQNKIEKSNIDKFSPGTQMVFLYILYSNNQEFEMEDMSEKLNVSLMTTVRAMKDLKNIGVINYLVAGKTGRKKVFKPINKKEYYKIGRKYLVNPVKKIKYVNELPLDIKIYKSGLTALSQRTNLAEPAQKVYAVNSCVEEKIRNFEVSAEIAEEEKLTKVQILKYDISSFTETEYVDPVTLIYGIDDMDERIEMALEELYGDEKWFVE